MAAVNRIGPFELTASDSELRCRLHSATAPGASSARPFPEPTLIYLPGLHGDWTLLGPFRHALNGRGRLLEFTYPRRTDWTLDDYARAVMAELVRQGVTGGWLLGESFSSQVAWAIARQCRQEADDAAAPTSPGNAGSRFCPDGIILVGGFVRHPLPWGVLLARRISGWIPMQALAVACRTYGRWAGRRCAGDGVDGREFELFAARRTNALDREAITSRYALIRDDDLRPAAREVRWPVYLLTGAKDPIVPWPAVRRWLGRECPGYRGSRVIWAAGHNVLLDAPGPCVAQILAWTKSVARTSKNGEPLASPLEPHLGQSSRLEPEPL